MSTLLDMVFQKKLPTSQQSEEDVSSYKDMLITTQEQRKVQKDLVHQYASLTWLRTKPPELKICLFSLQRLSFAGFTRRHVGSKTLRRVNL